MSHAERNDRYRAPDINRLLTVLEGGIPDRVPNYEVLVCGRNAAAILGRPESEDSWKMPPEDAVALAEKIGMDAVVTAIGGWGIPAYDSEGRPLGLDALRSVLKKTKRNFLEESRRSLERLEKLVALARPRGIGVCASPSLIFDRSIYTFGFENFFLALHDDRPLVEAVLDLHAEYAAALFHEICRYDISLIHTGDDIAGKTGLFMRPDAFRELWIPRMEKTLEIPRRKKIPLVFHSDGSVREIIPDLIELGFRGLNPLEPYSNDIYRIKEEFGDRITLIGNINIAYTLSFGTPEEVAADVKEHLVRLMPGGRYVCSSSHSITDTVKPENFRAMIETIHDYGGYGGSQG